MSNFKLSVMEKKFQRLSEKDIEAAKLYATQQISWEDVKYLLGYMVAQREQDIKDYAAEYAVEFDLYVLNCELQSIDGFRRLNEHAALLAAEYDMDVEDLDVATVINSLSIYIATGLIVL